MATWKSAVEGHKAEMSAMYLASNPTLERFLELKKSLRSSDAEWLERFLDGGGFQVKNSLQLLDSKCWGYGARE